MHQIVDDFRRGRFATRFVAAVFLAAVVGACGSDETLSPRTSRDVMEPTAPATQFGLSSAFDPYIFLLPTTDVAGAGDAPDQSDLNSFTRADNVTGRLGVAWTWDDINSWTGTGQSGDACALFDTDPAGTPANQGGGNADYAVCVRIHNPGGNPSIIAQLPQPESPIIYQCSDKKTDRCTTTFTIQPLGGSFCEVVSASESFPTPPNVGDDGADVLAACSIALSAIGNPSRTSLLNVCSFPSGSPNSNNFDCVVTPGSGFIQIKKATTPQTSGQTFNFTLNPAASAGTTSFNIVDNTGDDETSALIPVAPGTYSLTEINLPTGWSLTNASCSGGTSTANPITGITVGVGETKVCTFTNALASPAVTVVKTANPTTVPETGGSVTYSVVVTNDAPIAVTLTTLSDDKFGNLNGQGDCVTGGSIAAGANYSCSFTKQLAPSTSGATHTNVVTATVTNAGGTANDTDDATVTYTDVAPTVTVDKTANPTTVLETGGSVTYTVLVTNTSPEAVTLTTLTDDKFGNLDGQGTCDVTPAPALAASGGTYSCSFSKNISGNAGTSHVNVVTATVQDNDGSSANDTDDATVTFSNVAPTVTVDKTANPTSVAETGGSVSYSVVVTNNSPEAVTLTTLTDDMFGNLDGQGTCDVTPPPNLAASGGTYSCSFSKNISGNAGTSHVNVVTATVQDNDGSSANDTDDATVNFTNVNPSISVTKTANPTSLSTVAAGVLTFANPDRTWLTTPSSTPGVPSFASPTCDDGGPNDINSAQVDLNCFNRADNVTNRIHVKWSWDDIDEWGGSGSTGDACALLDTDNDGNANVAICARIQNDAQGNVVQIGGSGAADVYLCNDSKTDRCAKQVTPVTGTAKGTITSCTIGIVPDGFGGQGDHATDVEAICVIDRTMPGAPIPAGADLLNVCSFPSGEPNSNPFDCVVEVGAGFIQIVKVASPSTAQQFGFTLAGPATDNTSRYVVAGGVTSALIPVTPTGGSVQPYSLTETLPTNWDIASASCVVDGQSTGTFSLANKQVTGIAVKTGQTTVCTFNNTGLISGPVEYTIRVTNLGKEDVTLFSLVDDKFGDVTTIAGSTCATGGTIAGSAAGNQFYECKFTRTISGAAGTSHTNEITAVAKDNETPQNSDTKKASATVNFVSP